MIHSRRQPTRTRIHVLAWFAVFYLASIHLAIADQETQEKDRTQKRESIQDDIFQSDFSKGSKGWSFTDKNSWKTSKDKTGKPILSLHRKKSDYKPKVRSPLHIAILHDHRWESFQLDVEILSTHKDYNHRDACLFFGYQSPSKFYYVHLGKKTDPHANQVFIVNEKPRTKISTKTSPGTPWDQKWHQVRIVRNSKTGSIKVYFDDMKNPIMTADDKTFGKGQIGLGSFDDTADFRNLKIQPLPSNSK